MCVRERERERRCPKFCVYVWSSQVRVCVIWCETFAPSFEFAEERVLQLLGGALRGEREPVGEVAVARQPLAHPLVHHCRLARAARACEDQRQCAIAGEQLPQEVLLPLGARSGDDVALCNGQFTLDWILDCT